MEKYEMPASSLKGLAGEEKKQKANLQRLKWSELLMNLALRDLC